MSNTRAALLVHPADAPATPGAAVAGGDMPLQVQNASGPLTVAASEPAVLKASSEPAVLTVPMAGPSRNDEGGAVVSAADGGRAVEEPQAYRVSASTGPAGYYGLRELGRQVSSKPEPAGRVAAGTPVSGGDADSHFHMPYALVLALFALIGLVPVSRRNH